MIGKQGGQQLQGNSQALTDLRFADDILLFALSLQQILEILRSLVSCLRTGWLGIECLGNQVNDDPSSATRSSMGFMQIFTLTLLMSVVYGW